MWAAQRHVSSGRELHEHGDADPSRHVSSGRELHEHGDADPSRCRPRRPMHRCRSSASTEAVEMLHVMHAVAKCLGQSMPTSTTKVVARHAHPTVHTMRWNTPAPRWRSRSKISSPVTLSHDSLSRAPIITPASPRDWIDARRRRHRACFASLACCVARARHEPTTGAECTVLPLPWSPLTPLGMA